MDVSATLSGYNIAIVKHTYTPTGGAEQELLRYLLPRTKTVAYMSHPFPDARGVPLNTVLSIYERGELKQEIVAPLMKGPAPLFYAKDVVFTLWYFMRSKIKFDICVGVDNLNATSAMLLRRLGVTKKAVYYVIDYAPHRFGSRIGQNLYRMLDRRSCYRADAVWNVSATMEEARRADGADPKKCVPQIEVPLGCRYSEIKRLPFEKVDPNMIVFLGSLTREQGLDTMIEALPKLRVKYPQARLRVIGAGPELDSLKRLAVEKEVADAVEFLGFIEDDSRAAALAAEGVVGIAPYPRTDDAYKRFADPGKIKIYLAAGLPVIISRVPQVADLIEETGTGMAIEPGAENLVDVLGTLMSDTERIRQMKTKASELGQRYDWDKVFDRAFEQTFDEWK